MAGKSIRRLRFELERVIAQFRHGIHKSIISDRSTEIKTIRPYDPSDNLSAIDHMVSARVSDNPELEPMSRVYSGEKEISVVAFIDAGSTMALMARKAELAYALVWLFALSAFHYGDKFRIVWFGNGMVRDSHWIHDEDTLEEQMMRNDNPLKSPLACYGDAFSYGAELNMHDTVMIVVSDFAFPWANQEQSLMRFECAKRNVTIIFFMIDEWSDMRPSSYAIRLYDPATGDYVFENLRRGFNMQAWVKAADAHFRCIEQHVMPLSVICIHIPLLANPLDVTQKYLIQKGLAA